MKEKDTNEMKRKKTKRTQGDLLTKFLNKTKIRKKKRKRKKKGIEGVRKTKKRKEQNE